MITIAWGKPGLQPVQVSTHPSDIEDIIRQVARKYGLTMADMRSKRRHAAFAEPRQEAMWRCRQETLHSLPTIARALNRTHWTVAHGVETHQGRLERSLRAQSMGIQVG